MRIPAFMKSSAWLAVLAVLLMAAGAALADGDLPYPGMLDGVKGDKCVRPDADMRRNHMKYLKHHRNETMRQGIRTTDFSLKNCVECHASPKNNSVIGSNENFCQGCHVYAGVKLDCFECHASKPKSSPAFHPLATSGGLAGAMRRNMAETSPEPVGASR